MDFVSPKSLFKINLTFKIENFEIEKSVPNVLADGDKGILIDKIKYKFLISKEKDSVIIKLYDPNQKSKLYFSYEASYEKLLKDIKFFNIYENLDEIIDSLNDIFAKGDIKVEEKDGEYNLEFKVVGIKKKYFIQLTKHEIEQPKIQKNELKDKIEKLEQKIY